MKKIFTIFYIMVAWNHQEGNSQVGFFQFMEDKVIVPRISVAYQITCLKNELGRVS
jgi:hypothetical protein